MHKFHFDALERMDANLNAFFAQQLTQIRGTLYDKKYPELKARSFLPIKNDIPRGAQALADRTMDETGEAEFMGDYATDAPMVEVKADNETTYKMRPIHLGYGWHVEEAYAAQFAGVNLSDRKAKACRRGIERFIDKNLLIGSTVGGLALQGLFSLSGAQAPVTYTVQNPTWADESPDEICQDLFGIDSKVYVDSKEIEVCDSLLLPNTSHELLMNRRMGDGSNVTILKYFLDTSPRITNIGTSHYLEADGGHSGGSVKRMVAYKRDSEILEGLVNEFNQYPPEFRAMKVLTLCDARVGGVAAYRPKGIAYGDNI